MYSLPIATYTDYWRSARNRSFTVGSTLLLAGSTLIYAPVDKIFVRPELKLTVTAPRTSEGPVNPEQNIPNEASSTIENLSEPALPGLSGNVVVNYRIEDVEIPIATEYVESNQIAPGMSKVSDQGTKGVLRRVVKTTYVGGELNEEQTIHEFERSAAKKRVVIQNTQPIKVNKTIQTVELSQLNAKRTFTVEATAYTYTGNRTATGVWPKEGIIAVDPRVIPLGTQVYVEGYGYAVAADTGGAIKGNIIDVFFPTLQRCIDWGRRPVTIHIL